LSPHAFLNIDIVAPVLVVENIADSSRRALGWPMEGMTGPAVTAGVFLLTVLWLFGGWRRRRRRQASPQNRAPVAGGGRQLEAGRFPPKAPVLAVQWIGSGQRVRIGALNIEGGLFYVGHSLPTHSGTGTENCLVDPRLPFGRPPGNVSGEGVPYYPNYTTLTPESRRAYLDWLAGTRDDPKAYIGYVFLYFYGLERRLFLEDAERDHNTIIREVERLLGIYGGNRSFLGYASALLAAAAALTNTWPTAPSIDPAPNAREIPLRLRGAIGAMLKRGEHVAADWALAWYAASPDFHFRAAALRCWDEFLALYRQRFSAKFPSGLSFRVPCRSLAAQYRAASGSFTVTLHGEFESLPDIESLTAPLAELENLVNDCAEALEPYSRLVGRDPRAHESLAAQLSLPRELLQCPQPGSPIATARARLEALVPKASAMMSLASLMKTVQISSKSEDKSSKSDIVALAAALEILGFAMEPDPRHGGPIPSRESEVMLFRHHGQAMDCVTPSPEFFAARSHVEIAVLIATTDGDLDANEARTVMAQIRAIPSLSDFQRARLIGYLGYLVRHPPDVRAVARCKGRSLAERKALADFAVASAVGDGHLDAAEIKVLEKTYKTLGLSKDELYRNLHQLGAEDDEPPMVAHGTPARGIPIPPQKPSRSPAHAGIRLDKWRIAKIQAETNDVKSILDEVFNESGPSADEEPPPPAPISVTGPNAVFGGLDDRHVALLGEMVSWDTIAHTAFSELARKHGLFAAGAIETINEWSFQRFDEALLEDGELIEIARHLICSAEPSPVSKMLT
jgi:tellurite resistance protein